MPTPYNKKVGYGGSQSCARFQSRYARLCIGIQILKDLGLKEIRLLTNNPKKTAAFNLRGFDLTVVDQVPIIPPVNEHNAAYLATKREKMAITCRWNSGRDDTFSYE